MSEKNGNRGSRGERRGERWLNALTGPEDPEHHLPPMLVHRLLKLSNLIIRPLLMRRAEAYQMNLNELRVLTTLARMGEAASHELCEVAGIHPMNVSRAVGVLRAQGRLEERRDEDNRRRKLLRLTAEGRRISEELKPDGRSASARLFRGLDEKAMVQLSATIDKLTENALAEK